MFRYRDYEGIHNLAEHLRIARLALHLTQEEAADLTLISQSAISLYEQGRREPYVLVVKRLAEAYGVTMDWLLSISDDGGPGILKRVDAGQGPDEPESPPEDESE